MNAASQDQVPQEQTSDETQHERTLPTIGEFLAAVGATPVVVHPEYPGVPVVLLDIPGDWHEVARDVLPNAFGAWALPAEEGSAGAESGWVENAVLMVWRLSLPVDPRAVMRCAYTDSRRLEDWVELGGDSEDYDGFPSAEISGTYSYAGLSLWMSTRYLVASTPTGQYLLQLTVTTFADEIDEGVFIAESFTVQVPPARPGLGVADHRPEPRTGSQPLVAEIESAGPSVDSGFRSGMYEPEPESRWRQADSDDPAESFFPEVPGRRGNSGAWSEYEEPEVLVRSADSEGYVVESEIESSGRRGDFVAWEERDPESADVRMDSQSYEHVDAQLYESDPESYGRESVVRSESYEYESASDSPGSWDESSVAGSDSVIRGFESSYADLRESFAPDPLTGPHSTVRTFDAPVPGEPGAPSHVAHSASSISDFPAPQADSRNMGSHAAHEFESPGLRAHATPPGTGAHSVVQGFDSIVFEQEPPDAGFDTGRYESYGVQQDSSRHDEPADPDAYSTIMGIAPPPADAHHHENYSHEPDSPNTGNMDFRI